VISRVINGGVKEEWLLLARRLLRERQPNGAIGERELIELAALAVAGRAGKEQVFPGPRQPPVQIKRAVVLNIVVIRNRATLTVAALVALLLHQVRLHRLVGPAVSRRSSGPAGAEAAELLVTTRRQAGRLFVLALELDHEAFLRGTGS
jgi:hypothetical protein